MPSRDLALLAGAFAASGTVHVARPRTFEPLMPDWLPAHREVIVWSGVAELVLAAGLLHPATRRAAGWGSVALLVGVFPGNLTMAVRARQGDSRAYEAVSLARLPLQWVPLRTAWAAAHGRR